MTATMLLIGDRHSEPARAVLAAARGTWEMSIAGDIGAAAAQLQVGAMHPEVIVLAEDCSGELTHAGIGELRALAPLARVWRVLGSWCEGEQRSGHPPRGCQSIYWHQLSPRAGRHWNDSDRASLIASLPETFSAEERLLWELDQPSPPRHGRLAVVARDRKSAEALADACRAGGYDVEPVCWQRHCAEQTRLSAVDCIVWDADLSWLQSNLPMRPNHSHAVPPIVALLGFPRSDDLAMALRYATAVVSKPYLLADLWWQIDELIAAHGAV